MKLISASILALALAMSLSMPAVAKEAVVNIHWSASRAQLSISRMRVMIGPRIRKAVCDSYRKGTSPGIALRSGGSVRVNFIGNGNDLITSFKVTKDKCD